MGRPPLRAKRSPMHAEDDLRSRLGCVDTISRNGEAMDDSNDLATCIGRFNTTRLDMRINRPDASHRPDTAYWEEAAFIHETAHFYQTIFSEFGRTAWFEHRDFVSLVLKSWTGFVNVEDGRVRMPLAHIGDSIAKQVVPYLLHCSVQENLLVSRARHFLLHGHPTLEELGSFMIRRPWRINPPIMLDGCHENLQGKHILEGHAHFIERTFLERVLKVSTEQAWSRDGIDPMYTMAYDWFIGQVGREREHAFPLICDLALQTFAIPCLPVCEDDWRAGHPAWRFHELTRVLAALPELPIPEEINDNETYRSVANVLLSRAGYMTVDETHMQGMRYFERPRRIFAHEELFRRALEFRSANLFCLVNPGLSERKWRELAHYFKPPMVIRDGHLGSTEPISSFPSSQLVWELHRQALAAQIAGDISPESKWDKKIECGLAKFNIKGGCDFQIQHGCSGRYLPSEGSPQLALTDANGIPVGCAFEAQLNAMGLSSDKIDFDPSATFSNQMLVHREIMDDPTDIAKHASRFQRDKYVGDAKTFK